MEHEQSSQQEEMTWQLLIEQLVASRDTMIEISLTLQDALFDFEIASRRRDTVQKDPQEALNSAQH